jgi:hypothetical protein
VPPQSRNDAAGRRSVAPVIVGETITDLRRIRSGYAGVHRPRNLTERKPSNSVPCPLVPAAPALIGSGQKRTGVGIRIYYTLPGGFSLASLISESNGNRCS